MNICVKAKKFAIKAHNGQVRKSDREKPMIIHPINVANILREYGFDDNVIAAGYLHDVVEDTKYEEKDIKKLFGDDIASLVMGASEKDKSLSWEERKKETINSVKNLDFRHKAIVCADKISNLEDIMILFEEKDKYDFSSFKRGFKDQLWYYDNVYKSLVENEDKNHHMFIKLRELIDYVYFNKKNDDYVKDTLFENKANEYKTLKKINFKGMEIYKLKNILDDNKPYVIEFTGTPRTGKTTLIDNMEDYFKKLGFKVEVLEEFTTSKKYKREIFPTLKDKYKSVINTEIPKYILKDLENSVNRKPDIIIIDRSLFDRLIWVDRLFIKKGMNSLEYNNYKKEYIPIIKNKIDIIISTYTDSITALKRDYQAHLSLGKRNFLNEDNVNEYNQSLLNMKDLAQKENINFYLFDTTNHQQRNISIKVINEILSNMRKEYINRIYEELGKYL